MTRITTTALALLLVSSLAAQASMTINLPHLTWPDEATTVIRASGK